MTARIRRHRHRHRAVIVLLSTLVVLWGWFAVVKIYAPRLDPIPPNVDVLVQLGGVPFGDYQAARDIAQQRGIPDLVISNPISGTSVTDKYCGPLPGVRVHCFVPDPSTTKGEAQAFAELANTHGWASAFVLATGREHVERVRFYFNRCWGGTLSVNRPASERSLRVHISQSWYQTAGWIRAVFTNCP